MPSFSITPRAPYPVPTEPWAGGTQFRVNGVDVGPVSPAYVDIVGPGVTASYDADYGILTINIA